MNKEKENLPPLTGDDTADMPGPPSWPEVPSAIMFKGTTPARSVVPNIPAPTSEQLAPTPEQLQKLAEVITFKSEKDEKNNVLAKNINTAAALIIAGTIAMAAAIIRSGCSDEPIVEPSSEVNRKIDPRTYKGKLGKMQLEISAWDE